MPNPDKKIRYKYKVVDAFDDSSCVVKSSKYVKYYEKGSVVKATEGSFGIMVFNTYRQAVSFSCSLDNITKIKRVIPIGRGQRISAVCGFHPSNYMFDRFYKLYNKQDISNRLVTPDVIIAPDGTYAYPAVKVID